MIVTATLSEPAESTVKVELNGFSSDPKSFAAPIFDTILIAPGQLQGTVNIHISPYTEGDATDGSVDISATLEPTSEDITLVNPNVSGTVTTINGINTESGTATPGHPFTAEDPDGTEEKISVNDGRAVISTLPDGNLKVLVSGTTAKDSLTIASSSKTADTRFNIEQLIATSPSARLAPPQPTSTARSNSKASPPSPSATLLIKSLWAPSKTPSPASQISPAPSSPPPARSKPSPRPTG